jgi:hypothetical protein
MQPLDDIHVGTQISTGCVLAFFVARVRSVLEAGLGRRGHVSHSGRRRLVSNEGDEGHGFRGQGGV